jgi:peptidoglycan/xylan/chitin deacetylase (PgdA/CDA1 family)
MRLRKRRTVQQLCIIFFVTVFLIVLGVEKHATSPSVANTRPTAKISFTFDDGLASALTRAAPILAKYDLKGTAYVITDCIDTSGTCPANPDANYLSWSQVLRLRNEYGWEIGSHTETHPELASLPKNKQEEELAGSKKTLAEHGIDATDFASPYGDYSSQTLALTAKYYESHRGFWDKGANKWPYSDYLLSVQQLQAGTTVSKVKLLIDAAIKQKQWLIFVLHDIKDEPSPRPDDYEYAASDLDKIAAYAKEREIPITTIGQGTVTSSVNLLPDDSFDKGLSTGWTTDQPAQVTQDKDDNGSYPSPQNSLVLESAKKTVHLFSPKIDIDPDRTYMIKSFLHVATIASGEVGYYVDEYDAQGKWISGGWEKSETNAFAESINIPYKPSSKQIRKARVQVYVTAGSGVKAYVDNFQWFPMEQK